MDRRRAAWALLALAACFATTAAAPTISSNETALDLHDDSLEGCYYNFQHYGEGDRIMTNEPCLNCTCHNRMLMCYLRVCPFTKAIGQDCSVEKRADQCCPIVTCPDVPVDLLTSTTSSPAEYGGTGVGKVDNYGCSINGRYFPEGSKVPPTPNKPCEHCYCIRNMTTCVMQECTLHVDGCTPIYHKDVCCPVRYHCDHPENEMPLLDDMSTTVRPTQGFLLTTPAPTEPPATEPAKRECMENDQLYPDGALIKTEKPCVHCYCMKGDIVCVVQECGTPMENEGKNCTSLAPREGQCCPDTYICEGDEHATEITTPIDVMATTLEPPRRTLLEGSGYRNEPDDMLVTELPTFFSEDEGSGEEQVTEASDLLKPEKETSSGMVDERFGTEGDLVASTHTPISVKTTTGPDYGLTVPSEVYTTPQEERKPTEKDTIPSIGDEEKITETSLQGMTTLKEYEKVTEPAFTDELTETSQSEKTSKPFIKESTTLNQKEFTTQTAIVMDDTTIPDKVPESSEPSVLKETTPIDKHNLVPVTEYVDTTPSTILQQNEDVSFEPEIMQRTTYSEPITTEPTLVENQETTSAKATEDEPAYTGDASTIIPKESISEPFEVITTIKPTYDTTEPATPSGYEDEQTSQSSTPDLTTVISEIKTEPPTNIEQDITLKEETSETSTEHFVAKATEALTDTEKEHTDEFTTTFEGVQFATTVADHQNDEKNKTPIETSTSKDIEKSTDADKPTEPAIISDHEVTDASTTDLPEHGTRHEEGLTSTEYNSKYTTVKPLEETKEPATESILELSTFDHIPEAESATTSKYEIVTYQSTRSSDSLPETTSINPEDNEIGEDMPNVSSPGRIPGEGDCLLNGITYRNESSIPSTNKCHSGCRCISSIIKCDPIICGQQPEYMDNCQLTYDTPNSCCPTYICEHAGETMPPQPHSQMSGTESPLSTASIDCQSDNCEGSKDRLPTEISPTTTELLEASKCEADGCELPVKIPSELPQECSGDQCNQHLKPQTTVPASISPFEGDSQPCESPECKGAETPEIEKPCEGGLCTIVKDEPCEDEKCIKPVVTSQACENDKDCKQVEIPEVVVLPCEGNSCSTDELEKPCKGNDCKIEHGDKVSKVCLNKEDCKEVKIPDLSQVPCEGASCSIDKEECGTTGCISPPQISQEQEPCKDENGCDQPSIGTTDCIGDNCRRTPGCTDSTCIEQFPKISTQESSHTTSTSTESPLTLVTGGITKQTELPESFTSLPKEPVTNVPALTDQITEFSTIGVDVLETKTADDVTEKLSDFTTEKVEYFEHDISSTVLPEHPDVPITEIPSSSITLLPNELETDTKLEQEQEPLSDHSKVTKIPAMLTTELEESEPEDKLPATTDSEISDGKVTKLPESSVIDKETKRPEVHDQITEDVSSLYTTPEYLSTQETEITTEPLTFESESEKPVEPSFDTTKNPTETQDDTVISHTEKELSTSASVSKVTMPVEDDISQPFEPEVKTEGYITSSDEHVTTAAEADVTNQQAFEEPNQPKTENASETSTTVSVETISSEILEQDNVMSTEYPESHIPTEVYEKPGTEESETTLRQDVQTELPALPALDLNKSPSTEQDELRTESPTVEVSKPDVDEVAPTLESEAVTTEKPKIEEPEYITQKQTPETELEIKKPEHQLPKEEERGTELPTTTELQKLTTDKPHSLVTETELVQLSESDLSKTTATEPQTTEQIPKHTIPEPTEPAVPAQHDIVNKDSIHVPTEAPFDSSDFTEINTKLPLTPEYKPQSTPTQISDIEQTEKVTKPQEHIELTTKLAQTTEDQITHQTVTPEYISTEEHDLKIKDYTTISAVPEISTPTVLMMSEASEGLVTSEIPQLHADELTTYSPDGHVFSTSEQTLATEYEKVTTENLDLVTTLVTKTEELDTEKSEPYATTQFSEIPVHEGLITKSPDSFEDQTKLPKHEQDMETKAPESEYVTSPDTGMESEAPPVLSTEIPDISVYLDTETTVTTKIQETDKVTQSYATEKEEPVTTIQDATEAFAHGSITTQSPVSVTEPQEQITVETEPPSKPAATNIPLDISSDAPLEYTTETHVETSSTSEPKLEYSETTPYIIELEEHTHKIDEESSTIVPYEEPITLHTHAYETEPVQQITEMATEKLPTEEKQPEEHITELTTFEKETATTQGEELLNPTSVTPETDRILEKSTESSLVPSEEPLHMTKPTESQGVDDRFSTESEKDQDISTSSATQVFEEDVHTVTPQTTPVRLNETAKPSEHDIQTTTKPLETAGETVVPEEEFLTVTPISETTKAQEQATTPLYQPEEKPSAEVTSSASLPETPKPSFNELQPTDEVPTPEDESPSDFPPSGGYGQEPDYIEEDQAFGPGTCRYGGKVYVSAQQIPRDDPCDFCFCFRSDIICLQQSCPPPIHGCHEEPIQGFCCPRYECPVSMATTLNVTTTTTTTTTTLPPHFLPHAYKGAAQRRGCQIKGHSYKVGEVVRASSGPCLHCVCGGDGQMKCDPKQCTPEPMLRQMIAAAVSSKRRR